MADADGHPGEMHVTDGERVGARLRAARESAGKSLRQLSDETRITIRHIELVETGDFGALPGRPYAIGFARSCARALGLDEQSIVEAVRAELDGQELEAPSRAVHQFEVGDPDKTPGPRLVWFAVLLAVVVIGAGAVFWRSYYVPVAGLPPLARTQTTASVASATSPPAVTQASVPSAEAAASGPVVFTALDDDVWVKFYDGTGKQLMQEHMARGESYTVPADARHPQIWTGRPDALAITVGGRPVPPLSFNKKVVKDVPVSPAALLARASDTPPAPSASSTVTM